MILKNLDQIGSKEFEFTIIGSGPAGITLATTLAKKNKRILLKLVFSLDKNNDRSIIASGIMKICSHSDCDGNLATMEVINGRLRLGRGSP